MIHENMHNLRQQVKDCEINNKIIIHPLSELTHWTQRRVRRIAQVWTRRVFRYSRMVGWKTMNSKDASAEAMLGAGGILFFFKNRKSSDWISISCIQICTDNLKMFPHISATCLMQSAKCALRHAQNSLNRKVFPFLYNFFWKSNDLYLIFSVWAVLIHWKAN